MNVLTAVDLSADGAPLLRSGGAEDEEFLLRSFDAVALELSGELQDAALPATAAPGQLFVTTRRVVWIGNRAAPRVGLGWEMASITLHAISRDPQAYPRPCLYCQFDTDDVAEVRFIPADDKQLQEVFDAFSKSAEMNPDDEDEDEAGDGWIYDEEEVANGAREAQIAAHLDSVLHISPALQHSAAGPTESGQFDDADEDDELL